MKSIQPLPLPPMKIAVVGATGLVGTTILQILEERNFPISELMLVASEKSVGKEQKAFGGIHTILSAKEAIAKKPQIALVSAGGNTSLSLAPLFSANGTTVIDNSSAWRMHPSCPLIVPEVNGEVLSAEDKIIANPNCSTIQLVMVLHALRKHWPIKRVVVSTYQSVTGTGQQAVEELQNQIAGGKQQKVYPHPIFLNVLPHIDVFQDNGYTKEEMKMTNETCKILGDEDIKVTATCVRVPVMGGHSESVNIEFHEGFSLEEVKEVLSQTPGVTLQDDPTKNLYPLPINAAGKDDTFVGRVRRDFSQPNTLNCWIVADNLRKGAATNAVQIAELVRAFY